MSIVPSALDNDSCDVAIRASFLHFKSDPDLSGDAFEYFEDGLLILKRGRVRQLVNALDWIAVRLFRMPCHARIYRYAYALPAN